MIALFFLFTLQNKKKLSTHEKELAKMRSTIEEMEKTNLEPKTWTMRGEVLFWLPSDMGQA